MNCKCGAPATIRLRYTDGLGRLVISNPKCGRCADRAAFLILLHQSAFIEGRTIQEVRSPILNGEKV
jgi:hypothetical protein